MKKLIALLLVAVMCLSFVACDDESGNTETPPSGESNENNLEKIDRGTATTSENPLLPILFQTLADEGWSYTFNEDGTCADQVYWWIENDTENSMTIMVASEYKWKYQICIVYSAPYLLVQADDAMYMGDYFVAWQPPMEVYRIPYVGGTHTLLSYLYGEWKVKTDYSEPFAAFIINEDGTCFVDDIDATWKIADEYTTADNLYIEIYNGSGHIGGIMVWGNDKVVQGVGTNFGFTQGYYEKVTN